MALSKLTRASIIIYLIFNAGSHVSLYTCLGFLSKPTKAEIHKIKQARNLFIVEPGVKEPGFFIQHSQCYNAWADPNKNLISISRPVINEFSVEELAGTLGHEYGHLIASSRSTPTGEQMREHWKIDIVGAELTGKKLALKANYRFASIHAELFKKTWTRFLLQLPYYRFREIKKKYEFRNEKLKELPD